MDVTFTKGPGRSYSVAVRRERGPELAPRGGPGYHPYLPHDLVHFVVEAEAGLRGGVYGRLDAGELGFFWPADPAERGRARRREKTRKPTPQASADMGRSEELAGACLMLWELRREQRAVLSPWPEVWIPDPMTERIVARMDEYAEQWHALPDGGSLTVSWTCGPATRASGARRGQPAQRTAASRRR
ncbi:hypothetical protein [Streptomyces sp. NBC_00316]|uniref:hypothetical protein n=1 Tax=Streptomyces sp. NBC_00316 TaxID=2975710 RepID=UPI002E2DB942|nr:hypothetical protein [Streptomyces sp. NBC_00316]